MVKILLLAVLMGLPNLALAQTAAAAGETRVPLVFSGGYETDPQDRGRPVILIASALGVPSEVFRKAFSNVKPAGPGQTPQEDQVRKNKQVLMEALGPYGITDERLNAVSNYYRYSRSRGEMWRTTPASGYATVLHGAVTGVTVTESGSGFSSVPAVSIKGMPEIHLTAVVVYGADFASNGSVKEIHLAAAVTP